MGVSGAGFVACVGEVAGGSFGPRLRRRLATDVAGLSADDSEPSLAQRRACGRCARRPFESSGKRLRGARLGVARGTGRIACTRLTSLCEPDASDRRLGVVVPRRGASRRSLLLLVGLLFVVLPLVAMRLLSEGWLGGVGAIAGRSA